MQRRVGFKLHPLEHNLFHYLLDHHSMCFWNAAYLGKPIKLQKMTFHFIFQLIKDIMATVTIPVFAKVRIGHFAEAQILESLGVDMIDESEGRLH